MICEKSIARIVILLIGTLIGFLIFGESIAVGYVMFISFGIGMLID